MTVDNQPDITEYVDLRFFDKEPQDVFDAAVLDLQRKIPGWVPREDNTEVVLLESLALEVAEAIFAINRLPSSIFMALMKMYGIERDEGAPPVGVVQFNLSDTKGREIPAGTRLLLDLGGGRQPLVMSTVDALSVPFGSDTGTVAVRGNRNTSLGNGTVVGTYLELLDSISYVNTVHVSTEFSDGRDPEDDTVWLTRGKQRLARLTDTLVVPQHFTSAALELPFVSRATTLDLYDPSTGPPGSNPGHVTVAAYGPSRLLTTPEKDALAAEFSDRVLANLTVHVIDPTINSVNVTVTVKSLPGFTSSEVELAVTQALVDYLNPDTWSWDGTVRYNELIALISNVAGVDYVASMTAPSADVTMTGAAPLADAGTISVTVM